MNPFEELNAHYESVEKLCKIYPSLRIIKHIQREEWEDSLLILIFEFLVTENKYEIHKHIDDIIKESISMERHELTVYLLDYKKKHDLYTEPDWKL